MVNILDFKELFGIVDKIRISRENLPKHIAMAVDGTKKYADANKKPMEEANSQKFLNIKNIIKICTKLGIPLFTFFLMPKKGKEEDITSDVDALVNFFGDLAAWDAIAENQIKVTVIGKWYDLPGRLVDTIKKLIEDTKDYDKFFLNICLNYDGQEEIADACKIVGRQIQAGKIDPDSIDVAMVKDNTYASYFLPPELMIFTGGTNKTAGFMLLDSKNAKIFFTDILWPDFGKKEFLKAIEFYQGS
jgi:undecaprenyl diphosphate synthase